MIDFWRFIFANRRNERKRIILDRRNKLFPYNCKEASRMMNASIDRFDAAVHDKVTHGGGHVESK